MKFETNGDWVYLHQTLGVSMELTLIVIII